MTTTTGIRHEQKIYKSIGTDSLYLHLFYPADYPMKKNYPVLIFCHGGAWHKGKPDWFFKACKRYAARGLLTISVQYRLVDNDRTTPLDCIADVKSAIRWIRQHACELLANPEKIATAGFSAGAHLISCSAMIDRYNDPHDDLSISAVPDALILYSAALNNAIDPWFKKLLGNSVEIKQCSPYHNIKPHLPPFLILHGTEDEIVPVSSIEEFAGNMKRAGNWCDLFLFENKGHYFMEKYDEDREESYKITDRFLASLDYITIY